MANDVLTFRRALRDTEDPPPPAPAAGRRRFPPLLDETRERLFTLWLRGASPNRELARKYQLTTEQLDFAMRYTARERLLSMGRTA